MTFYRPENDADYNEVFGEPEYREPLNLKWYHKIILIIVLILLVRFQWFLIYHIVSFLSKVIGGLF